MTINEKIYTTLDYKEVALIACALGFYQDEIKKINGQKLKPDDQEIINAARQIVDRLGDEIYSYPDNNFVTKS